MHVFASHSITCLGSYIAVCVFVTRRTPMVMNVKIHFAFFLVPNTEWWILFSWARSKGWPNRFKLARKTLLKPKKPLSKSALFLRESLKILKKIGLKVWKCFELLITNRALSLATAWETEVKSVRKLNVRNFNVRYFWQVMHNYFFFVSELKTTMLVWWQLKKF